MKTIFLNELILINGFFTIAILLIFTTGFTKGHCKKCEINQIFSEHMDSLTFQMIEEFLYTFNDSCKNNVEFSEWRNGALFKVINSAPTLFFSVIVKSHLDNRLLLNEIESPIDDLIDLQATYDKLNTATAPNHIKAKFLMQL
jgi:hypothetical protein